MLSTYTMDEGATEADIGTIKRAMEHSPVPVCNSGPTNTQRAPGTATRLPLEGGWGRLSWRKAKHFANLTGGADGTPRFGACDHTCRAATRRVEGVLSPI
jgi:hypothetical protein